MSYRTCESCGVMYPHVDKYFQRNKSGELHDNCKRCHKHKFQ